MVANVKILIHVSSPFIVKIKLILVNCNYAKKTLKWQLKPALFELKPSFS